MASRSGIGRPSCSPDHPKRTTATIWTADETPLLFVANGQQPGEIDTLLDVRIRRSKVANLKLSWEVSGHAGGTTRIAACTPGEVISVGTDRSIRRWHPVAR